MGKKIIYDENFYLQQYEGSLKSAREILHEIRKVFPQIQSIIDVGCGVGTWLKAWKEIDNNIRVLGIDGNEVTQSYSFLKSDEYRQANLTDSASSIIKNLDLGGGGYDLVQSLEVAEHLDQQYSKNFITLLTSLSKIVLFSAAIPFQGGVHHVNEQAPKYWADLFMERDFFCFDILRDRLWNNTNIDYWYRQNIMLFVHKDKVGELENLSFAPTNHPRYLIAPELWEFMAGKTQKKRKIFNFLSKKA
ncbi:class I SAM-dependent methyltransferase [Helicobacter brantae]|uniref:Class I SAM-dependent methyltransferase n=1 Tax=Helicobacter brantae TaxID=375927 RepID=A0A3D8J2U6_9HELI|nr:class I SAM-dependent methyltransferase [Helicobacter brantae]RDU71723.1 class I SAM-dependent methyltransferase [Helicobacter brantae]